MELERPKIDRQILDFVKNSVFDPADFTLRSDGVCRLNPEMTRLINGAVSLQVYSAAYVQVFHAT
jgi:hypothetical protein